MPKVTVNDIELYYELHGRGTPLLLIAGLASDSQSWQPIIKELSQHYLVITPDNRGVGRTSPQDMEMSIQQIADDCVALINHLGFSSVNLLGHSMGSSVALDIAIRYPDCVNKLILAGTFSSISQRNNALFSVWVSCLESGMDLKLWFRNMFYWIFSRSFFEDETVLNEAVKYAIDYPYPQSTIAFRNQVEAIIKYDCTEDLANINSKTLVISGKEDILISKEESSALAQEIPDAEFSVIDEAAHSIHMEQPQLFTNCVLDFLFER